MRKFTPSRERQFLKQREGETFWQLGDWELLAEKARRTLRHNRSHYIFWLAIRPTLRLSSTPQLPHAIQDT